MSFLEVIILRSVRTGGLRALRLTMEVRLRIKSIHFLRELARILKLCVSITSSLKCNYCHRNTLVIASAAVYFHRFYQQMSFQQYHRLHIVTVCLFIASKVEESPRKMKDIVIGYLKCVKDETVRSLSFFLLRSIDSHHHRILGRFLWNFWSSSVFFFKL